MKKGYSFWKGLGKALWNLLLFVIPVLVNQFVVVFPEIAELPLGAVLVLLSNWLKVGVGVRLIP